MLFLLFQLGEDRYALEAGLVVEVLPLLRIKRIPQAPAGVVGACNYRGAPVPVLDLSQLALGRPPANRLSTRLVLVHYPDGTGGRRLLGLIAEKATETMRRDPADFGPAGLRPDRAPYLGPVAVDARGLVQWIDPGKLLPDSVREILFTEPLAL